MKYALFGIMCYGLGVVTHHLIFTLRKCETLHDRMVAGFVCLISYAYAVGISVIVYFEGK